LDLQIRRRYKLALIAVFTVAASFSFTLPFDTGPQP